MAELINEKQNRAFVHSYAGCGSNCQTAIKTPLSKGDGLFGCEYRPVKL